MAQHGDWPTGKPAKGYGIACVSVETVGNPRRGAGGRICSIFLLVLTGRGEGSQNPLFPSQLSQPLTCLTKETKTRWHLSQKCRITSISRHRGCGGVDRRFRALAFFLLPVALFGLLLLPLSATFHRSLLILENDLQ